MAASNDDAATCQGMQDMGLGWLTDAQLTNWSMMCESQVMRDRLIKAWSDDSGDTDIATMSMTDFMDRYEEYWGDDVDPEATANFASISDNLYGNKMACSNLNSNLTASPNTVAA